MHRLRALLKRKLFRTFLLSFLLVFMIPLTLVAGMVSRSIQDAERKLETTNQLFLEQFKSGFDAQLSSIARVGASLITDERVLTLANMRDPLSHLSSSTTFVVLKTLLAEIAGVGISNEEVSLCYLYLERSDKVLAGAVTDAEDFFHRRLLSSFASVDEWRDFLFRGRNGFFAYEGVSGLEIGYMRSLPSGLNARVTLVMLLDPLQLLSFHGGEGAAVFDSLSGDALYRAGLGWDLLPTPRMLSQESGSSLVQVADEMARIYWHHSAATGCVYFTLTSEASYQGQLNTLRRLLILSLIAATLLGGGLCLYLAWRSDRPIRNLLAFASGISGEVEVHDDFGFLRKSFETLKEEKRSVVQRMRHQRHSLRHFALDRLLTGQYTTASAMEEDLLGLDIGFATDLFVVVRLYPLADHPGMDGELLGFALANIFEELLEQADFDCYIIPRDQSLVALLNLRRADDPLWQQSLSDALSHGQRLAGEHFDCAVSIVASRLLQGYGGIREGFLDVQATACEGQISLLWTKTPANDSAEAWSADQAQRFINQILMGDEEAALAAVVELRKSCQGLPRWQRNLRLSMAVSACLRALSPSRMNAQERRDAEQKAKAILEERAPDSFDSLAALVVSLCGFSVMEEGRGAELAARAHRYIDAHYRSQNLSVAEVADHLQLGASYASMLYRKETGESMLDTINRLRLAQAKLLLNLDKIGSEEIAHRVGYASSATFHRAFKKYEGMTPGQYRMRRTG